MKIGLDYHGVISEYSEFFRELALSFMKRGHEIHIITGLKKSDFLKKNKKTNIPYNYFYSITDDLLDKISYIVDIEGRPRFSEYGWNTAKAKYCEDKNIDMMFDDSDIYGKYFSTPYIKVKGEK